ncbi:hypothetical protein V1278_004913 [Bradyrhizobium sp. AZCC 1577]
MTRPPPVPQDNQSHKGTGDPKSGNAHEVRKGRGRVENTREQGQQHRSEHDSSGLSAGSLVRSEHHVDFNEDAREHSPGRPGCFP